jgi:hypothetical protein
MGGERRKKSDGPPVAAKNQAAEMKTEGRRLLTDIRQQCHEPGALNGHLDCPLKGSAIAAAFAAEELALAGAHLLEALNIFVIDKGRPRAAFLGAEPAAILPPSSELFADHLIFALKYA